MVKTEQPALPVIYLPPGGLYVADRPTVMTTVLGSCVSVVMYSPALSIGGMCHAMLPRRTDSIVVPIGVEASFKFVDASVAHMLKRFKELGVDSSELEVKLFGGANMFAPDPCPAPYQSIGKQNIKAAVEIIESFNLNLLVSDVGGNQGRKIKFLSYSGAVLMQFIGRSNPRDTYLEPAWT